MRYDVSEHPILSGKAAALADKDEDKFAEWNTLAETVLGFDDMSLLTGADAVKAKRYVALQVNWFIEINPDALVLKSISSGHSGQSKVFRDNQLISPYVRAGVSSLTSKFRYRAGLRSIRGGQS